AGRPGALARGRAGPADRPLPAARRHPAGGDGAAARRADHRGVAAAAGPPVPLPQGPRPRLVRVRGRLDRRRARRGRRRGPGRADRLGRGGAQAVAGDRGRAGAARRPGHRGGVPGRRRRRACRGPTAAGQRVQGAAGPQPHRGRAGRAGGGGPVTAIGTGAVLAMPGVLAVLWHGNAPRLAEVADHELLVFQSDRVAYHGQFVAAVVADSLEAAREAAARARVEIDEQPHDTELRADRDDLYTPEKVNPNYASDTSQGDVDAELAASEVTVDVTYETAATHNNPMEPHASTAQWLGD